MLLGRSLEFRTPEAPEGVLRRLSSVILSIDDIAPLRPVPVDKWVGQHVGKRFVGWINGSRFKLGLLPAPGGRFQVRGSVVVMEGHVDGHTATVTLRPPLFVSAFLIAFTLLMAGGLVLSFLGPSNGPVVPLLLALALALPWVVVAMFFRREASLAEQALRQVLQDR